MARLRISGLTIAAMAALTVLGACATPQQRCVQNATRDLQTLRALIAETEANVSRGYAFRQEVRPVRVGVSACTRSRGRVGVGFCAGNDITTVRRPVAIDLDAERSKLASLRAKELEVASRARPAIEACAAAF